MIELIFQTLGAGIRLLDVQKRTSYMDKYLRLQTRYYEELKKPHEEFSDANLDDIILELRLLCSAFASSTAPKNIEDK